MKVKSVYTLFFNAVLVVYHSGTHISFSFEITIFFRSNMFFIVSFKAFLAFGSDVVILLFFPDISKYGAKDIFERKTSALTIFNNIKPIKHFYSGTCFYRLEYIKFSEFIGQSFELHSMSGINRFGKDNITLYLFAFTIFKSFKKIFFRDTAVDTEEFDKNCFFIRFYTRTAYDCLIGFLRVTEDIVVCRDNSTTKRSVMYSSIVAGDTSI